jgi:hypothetical protein
MDTAAAAQGFAEGHSLSWRGPQREGKGSPCITAVKLRSARPLGKLPRRSGPPGFFDTPGLFSHREVPAARALPRAQRGRTCSKPQGASRSRASVGKPESRRRRGRFKLGSTSTLTAV